MSGEEFTTLTTPEVAIKEFVWLGNVENDEWRELKEENLAERGGKCSIYGCTEGLNLHHIKARRIGSNDDKHNLLLLCRSCHAQTSSFDDHGRFR